MVASPCNAPCYAASQIAVKVAEYKQTRSAEALAELSALVDADLASSSKQAVMQASDLQQLEQQIADKTRQLEQLMQQTAAQASVASKSTEVKTAEDRLASLKQQCDSVQENLTSRAAELKVGRANGLGFRVQVTLHQSA